MNTLTTRVEAADLLRDAEIVDRAIGSARSIRYTWTHDGMPGLDGEGTMRTYFEVTHDKNRKRFTAFLSRESIGGHFTRVHIAPGEGLMVTTQPVGRYSAKGLRNFDTSAFGVLMDAIRTNEPRVLALMNGQNYRA